MRVFLIKCYTENNFIRTLSIRRRLYILQQNVWSWCGHYQDIYDWISPFNKPSDWWFILTQQCMVEYEYGKSGHLSFFHFFEALSDACFLTCIFQRIHFVYTPYQRNWYSSGGSKGGATGARPPKIGSITMLFNKIFIRMPTKIMLR